MIINTEIIASNSSFFDTYFKIDLNRFNKLLAFGFESFTSLNNTPK